MRPFLEPDAWSLKPFSERARVMLVALLVGVCGALVAEAFRLLIAGAWRAVSFGLAFGALGAIAIGAAPAVGGLAAGALLGRSSRNAPGPDVGGIRGSLMQFGAVSLWPAAVSRAIACALTVGSGGSAGCEGPIGRLSAGVGTWLAGRFQLSRARFPTLAACGVSAAVAALFDAPIAGVVLAVESVLGGFALRSFAPLIVSAASSLAVVRLLHGRNAAFPVPAFHLQSLAELPAYATLGAACGVAGALFLRALDLSVAFWKHLPLPPWVRPGLAGLMVGLLTLLVPAVSGAGYPALGELLTHHVELSLIAALLAARFLATCATLGSGGAGGLFAPSLVMGACVGLLLGTALHSSLPIAAASPASFAIVGAAAMLAATKRIPFTAAVLVFELTQSYNAILPAMVASIAATILAALLRKTPPATAAKEPEALHAREASRGKTIAHLVRDAGESVAATEDLRTLMRRRATFQVPALAVTDRVHGEVIGVLDLVAPDLWDAAEEAPDGTTIQALMTHCPPVREDDAVTSSLGLMVRCGAAALPVVGVDGKLTGLLQRQDVLEVCAKGLVEELSSPVLRVTGPPEARAVVHAHVVVALPAPSWFVGRTVREVDLGRRHRVVCLGIRRATDTGLFAPVHTDPMTVYTAFDVLIVSGEEERVEAIRGRGAAGAR